VPVSGPPSRPVGHPPAPCPGRDLPGGTALAMLRVAARSRVVMRGRDGGPPVLARPGIFLFKGPKHVIM
jgi:hypothetical protein